MRDRQGGHLRHARKTRLVRGVIYMRDRQGGHLRHARKTRLVRGVIYMRDRQGGHLRHATRPSPLSIATKPPWALVETFVTT